MIIAHGGGEIAKVLDFGVAKALNEARRRSRRRNAGRHPEYMAPAQLRGGCAILSRTSGR